MSGPGLTRRAWLGGAAGAGVALGTATASAATVDLAPRTDAEVWGVPTLHPLVRQRADPFVTPRVGGRYWFTGSVPEYDRLVVRGASTLAGLATAPETVVWRRPRTGRTGGYVWAPELHRFGGNWHIYFAAGDAADPFRIRMYVMSSGAADPGDVPAWGTPRQVVTPWDSFALDATTFSHRGRRYLLWAQSEPEVEASSSLYVAELGAPHRLRTPPRRIASPTRAWEVQGFRVNEGAAILKGRGRIWCAFSASATDDRYCMGLLSAGSGADLLDPRSWRKEPEPVFVSHDPTRRYGPGHCSFTKAEDGTTDVLVYHARDYRQIVGDPLFDPNRHARVQKVVWHEDGTPMFGVPVGDGGPVVRLAPRDARRARVRHQGAGEPIVVETRTRDLASTQWRLEPGLAGAGTWSVASVDRPDHLLRVEGGQVVLRPRATNPAYVASASFRRVPRPGDGLALQLRDGRWLAHRGGRLVVTERTGPAATFDRD